MENSKFISELIYELILEGFYIKKEEFNKKDLSIKNFINENVYNEKFPDIKSYKVISAMGSTCGFYTLFYTVNYLKYILKDRDIYYLYKNTLGKSFFGFYKKFVPFFISKMPTLEKFEIEELKKDSPLERHHLDFILKNNLIYEFMGKKYKPLFEEYINVKKYKFEYEWFDFISNNFSLFDIVKIKRLNKIFNEILECSKSANPPGKIFFLYIGLTEHWILVIYDSFYKNNFIEMDSYSGTKDIINLKFVDDKEIEKFVNKVNKEIIQVKRTPLNKYQIKQFTNSIYDTQRVLYKLNNILLNNEFSLGLAIMEEKCDLFLKNFENLKINKNEKLKTLITIYNWLKNEYNPKWIKEDYYDIMKELDINKNNNNLKIKNFFELIKDLKDFINENIKLIEEKNILELLTEGINVFSNIYNISSFHFIS